MRKRLLQLAVSFAILLCTYGVLRVAASSAKVEVSSMIWNQTAGVYISWDELEGATQYRIYRKIPDGNWEIICSATPDTSFVDESAENGEYYIYSVRAQINEKYTNRLFERQILRLTQPVPETQNRSNGIRLSWEENPAAEVYDIYRRTAGTSWVLLTSTKKTVYSDFTPESGVYYYYMVRARVGNTRSGNLNKSGIRCLGVASAKTENTKTGVSVTWEPVAGAKSYDILRKVSGGSWKVIKSRVQCLEYTDSSAVSGTSYRYAVRARSGIFTGGYSAEADHLFLDRPEVKVASVSVSSVKASWTGVDGAERYELYMKRSGEGWSRIYRGTKRSFTASDLVSGDTYFKVRAVKDENKGCFSASVSRKVTYPATDAEACLEPNKGIRISWDEIDGAQSYRVYRRTPEGEWTTLKTTTDLYFVDTKGQPGVTYEYAVRAFQLKAGKGLRGYRSPSVSIVYSKVDPSKPMVALTFDDGPSKYTTDILDALEEYGGRVTFFVVGQRVSAYSKIIRRAYNLGCEIGNHSWSHPVLSSISIKSLKKELSDTDDAIEAVIGITPSLLRPPYGAVDSDVKKYANKPLIHWSIDTRDWEHRSSSLTVKSVMNNVRDGSIVLMHDIYAATRTAAVELIPKLISEGYQLVTVSELAAYRNVELKDGKIYYAIYP